MKKFKLLTLGIILTSMLSAQNFVPTTPTTNLNSVFRGDMDLSDVDGDQDLDVLITGSNEDVAHSTLYLNEGNSTFKKAPAPFTYIVDSHIEFGDIDGDNDEDVVMIGKKFNFSGEPILEIYSNDGLGNFVLEYTEMGDIPKNGNLKMSDIDNDGDLDLVINGFSQEKETTINLFTNDGNGNFERDLSSNLKGTVTGSLIVADLNNDGYQDILVFGNSSNETLGQSAVAILYLYDGNDEFIETESFILGGIGIAKAADVDGDNDIDIVFSGLSSSGINHTQIYFNDGLGAFTTSLNNNLPGLNALGGDLTIFDANNDSHPDIFIGGYDEFGFTNSKMFINNGDGIFSLSPEPFFFAFHSGKFLPIDVDNDGDQDLLFGGAGFFGTFTTQLFINNGATTATSDLHQTNQKITIYPNPSNTNFITIHRTELVQNSKISIVNSQGHFIGNTEIDTTAYSKKIYFDVSHLPKGIYFVKIEEPGRVITEKFIRQ